MAFVHLHVHTQYSLLQGAILIEKLFEKVQRLEMKAIAMTDTHNLFGAIDFYMAAKKLGIKPILGCEIFYAPHGRPQVSKNSKPSTAPHAHHLVLLCKNLEGYQNLCQMITQSYVSIPAAAKGQPAWAQKPIIDRELLNRYGDGLIVLSGCLRGELPYQILMGEESQALESLGWFKRRFGEDFFLELQDTPLPEQDQVNETLSRWGAKAGVECVATTDCHYLEPEDAEAHEVLQCIEHGRNLDIQRPKSLVPSEYYLKSEQEMRARFERFPEACDQSQKIADRCNLEFRFKDDQGKPIYHLPNFRPAAAGVGVMGEQAHEDLSSQGSSPAEAAEPFDLISYFRAESERGLRVRFNEAAFQGKRQSADWPEKEQQYWARLTDELVMVERTGFVGYFLIVADFINWAKAQRIPVGPGRGSGAGSLIAYSLRITDIDPIEFKLLFERFINPERISMPDFDVDFCQDRRGEVIQYVSKRYGPQNVCQIITFGKLQARAVIRDVGRVLGLSFAETDQITKLLPDELEMTLEKALRMEPRLVAKMAQEPKIALVMKYAQALEGLYRNAGIHAAGVIITEKPVVHYCPLFVAREGALVTQFDKDFSEVIGLVKFDFLGLKTLTVIDQAIQLIHGAAEVGSPEADFELERMNYQDPKVFALISSGDTDGIFQIESSGMKDLCCRLQPNSLEDLTAINALYRPGPLGSGMVDDFIECKHGRKTMVFEVELLAPILKETYGVILYQEQVMQIARELAGYSLGQADLLRRAMGKKKPEEMAKHRAIFVQGAVAKAIPVEKAELIFDLMAKFAEYGFNKSHSAAYGMLTYQTAYLKTHFPTEFMAALMTTEMDHTEKITKYIADARQHQLPILSPDINLSQRRFSVEQHAGVKGVRFGLEAIKGVGGIAVDVILEARKNGNFQNVIDFCYRVPPRKVNKKVMEALCLAGAFDGIAEVSRASLFASLEALLEHSSHEAAEKEMGQVSFFDAFTPAEIQLHTPVAQLFKQEEDWPVAKKLALEREVVGFFISGHPMDPWQPLCERWLGWDTEKLKQAVAQKQRAPLTGQSQSGQPHKGGSQKGGGVALEYGDGPGPGRYRAPKTEVRLAGLISELKEVTTKKGARMAFAQLEDVKGRMEAIFFPEAYQNCAEILKQALASAEPLVVTAEVDFEEESLKLAVKSLEWAAVAHLARIQHIEVHLQVGSVTSQQLMDLKRCLLQSKGKFPVTLRFHDPRFATSLALPKTFGFSATPDALRSLNQVFGREVVVLL